MPARIVTSPVAFDAPSTASRIRFVSANRSSTVICAPVLPENVAAVALTATVATDPADPKLDPSRMSSGAVAVLNAVLPRLSVPATPLSRMCPRSAVGTTVLSTTSVMLTFARLLYPRKLMPADV